MSAGEIEPIHSDPAQPSVRTRSLRELLPTLTGLSTTARVALVAGAFALTCTLFVAFWVPRYTFWSIDGALKYIQMQCIRQVNGTWHYDVPYFGQKYDPELHFFSVLPLFIRRMDGFPYFVWPELFALVVSPLYRLLGWLGIFVVPICAGTTCVVLTALIAERVRRGAGWIAAAVVAISTPIFFYSVQYWEHTPAVALGLLALLFLARYPSDGKPWRIIAGAAVCGFVTCGLRIDMLLWTTALFGGLFLTTQRHERGRLVSLAALGFAAGSEPACILNLFTERTFLPSNISNNISISGEANTHPRFDYLIHGNISILSHFLNGKLSPIEARYSITIGTLGLVGLYYLYLRFRWRLLLPLTLVMLVLIGAASLRDLWWLRHAAPGGAFNSDRFHGTLGIAPVVVLGLLGFRTPTDDRIGRTRRTLLYAAMIYATFVVGIIALTYPDGIAAEVNKEWGPRYWLAIFPLLAVLVAANYDALPSLAKSTWWRRASWAGLALLFVLGAGFNVEGLFQVYGQAAEFTFDRIFLTSDQLPLVTDLWFDSPNIRPEDFIHRPSFVAGGFDIQGYRQLIQDFYHNGLTRFKFLSRIGPGAQAVFRNEPSPEFVVVIDSTEAARENLWNEKSAVFNLWLVRMHLVPADGRPTVYDSPTGGTDFHVMLGEIGARYIAIGGPHSYLGLPTSHEGFTNKFCPGGRFVRFQHGFIDWCLGVGAWAHGEPDIGPPGLDNDSPGVYAIAPPELGAPTKLFALQGPIHQRYVALGEADGFLGLPLSMEKHSSQFCPNGLVAEFEHGYIDWCPETGAWVHVNPDDVVSHP